jgi:hypothetical protein
MTLQGAAKAETTEPASAKVGAWCRTQLASDVLASEDEAATKLVQLLSGSYDTLTGRYITVWDDLDELVERIHNATAAEFNDYLMLRPQA